MTVTKTKIAKHSIPTKCLSKLGTRYTAVKSMMGWRDYDPGEKWAESIAQYILDFAYQDTSMSFVEFFIWFGIPERSYYNLRTKYEIILEAHDMAKLIFGARREKKGLDRTLDPGMIQRTLFLYHPDWREAIDEERAFKTSLSAKEKNQAPTKVTVIMQDYGNTTKDTDTVE